MGASVKEKQTDAKKSTTKRRPGRTATSCAECRRLKLRCDRQIPCGKCVSRGCAAICPDGSLTAGKGNRLVLANTEQLHDRIEQLCSRIRDLESALRGAQAQLSEEEHPLLQSELLQLKSPHTVYPKNKPDHQIADAPIASGTHPSPPQNDSSSTKNPEDENLIDAFGTLSIRENGETQFLGQTARSEYLIRALAKPQKSSIPISCTRLSQKIINGAHFCRDDSEPSYGNSVTSERDTYELGQEVFGLLPPLSEAIRLCEVYLEYGKYMYTPLPRTQLFDEILASIYRSNSFDTVRCYHSLSLIFIIFAIASLFDPSLPSCSVQAQEYFYLSKAALSFNSPFSHTTFKSIWCMLHIAQFLEFSDWEAMGSTAGWAYIGHVVRMGTSIGFHLNSSRWSLPHEIQQMQYRLFWTVFTADTWSSFYYGRPPSLSRAYVDCPLPKDTEEFVSADGEREPGCKFHYWSWQFTAFVHAIMEETFGSSRPAYSTIIDFDRKIRDFPIPVNLRVRCGVLETRQDLYLQRLIVMCYKENMLMHLHRAYFAQALQDSPDDLTTHKYVASVIATYRSAWRLSKAMQIAWMHIPHLLARYHLAWSQVLSSAIVMCILVTRAPNSKMTKSSVEELDGMTSLFEEAAPTSRSAANILDTMRNLRRKAREVIDTTASADGTSNNSGSPAESSSSQSGSDHSPSARSPCAVSFTSTADLKEAQGIPLSTFELDRLGGRTHLISSCKSSKPSTPVEKSASSPSSSDTGSDVHPSPEIQASLPTSMSWAHRESLPSSSQQHLQQLAPVQNLHPTIVQDIRNIEMDVDMNFGEFELHFLDPPTANRTEIQQSFGLSLGQQQGDQDTSQHGNASLRYPTALAGSQNQDIATSSSQYSGMSGMAFDYMSMGGEDTSLHMGDLSTMGGGANVFGNSILSPSFSTGTFSTLGHPPANAQLLPGAPVLDASWQSFVEQLGF